MEDNQVKKSRFLSYTLRHHPQKIGLTLDAAGWADIDELIAKSAAHGQVFDEEELLQMVANNPKKRFAVEGRRIRANQGHSIEVDLELPAIIPPEILYHGTATRTLPSIRQEGLKKMRRHHVHLSADEDTARQVGMRYGKPVILNVFAARMVQQGFSFYRSQNGVYLTEFVPPEFIEFPNE